MIFLHLHDCIADRGRNQYKPNRRFPQSSFEQDSQIWANNSNNVLREAASLLHAQLNHLHQTPRTVFTVHCGEIRPRDEGTKVQISGKVVKRPRTGRFLEIKDLKGCTQLVATDDKPEIGQKFQAIPADAYVEVIGIVQLRPSNFINNVSRYLLY
jgi:hypothetical protein